MSASIFTDKSIEPDDDRLISVLGESAKLWQEIKRCLEEKYGSLTPEWKFYGKTSGWLLKMLRKKRNLFFHLPLDGYFTIAFVFGDRALTAVEQSDLPLAIIDELRNARKYAEGRGIRIDVKSADDVENVLKLVDIKISH
jgi:signal transduction histidine kinase